MSRFIATTLKTATPLALAAACVMPASAATVTWTGGGTGDANGKFWNDADNWNTGVPTTADIANFTGAPTSQIVNVNVDVDVNRVTIAGAGSGFTFNTATGSTITTTGGFDIFTDGVTQTATFNVDVLAADSNANLSLRGNNLGAELIFNGSIGYAPTAPASRDVALGTMKITLNGAVNTPDDVQLTGGIYTLGHVSSLGNSDIATTGSVGGTLLLATDVIAGDSDGAFGIGNDYTLGLATGVVTPKTLTILGRLTGSALVTVESDITIDLSKSTSHSNSFDLAADSTIRYNKSDTLAIGTGTSATTISGAGSIVSDGIGQLSVVGDLSHTGGTSVNDGAMRLNGGSMSSSGLLSISAGAAFQANGQTETLGGVAGNGTLDFENGFGSSGAGSITLTEGVAPGIGGVGSLTLNGEGTLTLGGNSVFEIASLGSHDTVVTSDNEQDIVIGGTLEIVDLGSITAGDYTLFDMNGGTISGSFSLVTVPAAYIATFSTATGDGVLTITLVPEPASLVLLGLGAVAMMTGRRRSAA